MSGGYQDKILSDDSDFIKIEYFGQRKGGRDYLIQNGAYFFIKENKKYKLLGKVSSVEYEGIKNQINVYTLIIKKENDVFPIFCVKNDICDYFGWPRLNSFERTHGIIQHK
jgi:hypothetical protein